GHEPGPGAAAAVHAKPGVDARPAPAHHPRDDRDDPLARATAISPRRPSPSAWRRSTATADRGRLRRGGTAMIRRAVVARATSSGLLADAGRGLALQVARRIQIGRLTIVLPDGTRQVVGTPGGPAGELHLRDV